MAQLRDSKTSELIAEGTPVEVALIATKLGRAEVIFDDVGLHFDPDATLAAHEESVAALEEVVKSRAQGITADDKAAAKATLATLPSTSEKATTAAKKRLKDARTLLEG